MFQKERLEVSHTDCCQRRSLSEAVDNQPSGSQVHEDDECKDDVKPMSAAHRTSRDIQMSSCSTSSNKFNNEQMLILPNATNKLLFNSLLYIHLYFAKKCSRYREKYKQEIKKWQKLSPLSTICHADSRPTIQTVRNQNNTLSLCNENWPLSSHIVLPNAEDGRQHR